MKYKRQPRSTYHKNCKHEFRLLEDYKGYYVFYCIKCLMYSLKEPDEKISLRKYINKFIKKNDRR